MLIRKEYKFHRKNITNKKLQYYDIYPFELNFLLNQ